MTLFEIKSTLGISFIYILRMLGLFIVLPIMAIYLKDFTHNVTYFQIGLAFGIYGLTQALFQIPFGILSDKFGRKQIIFLGLFIFFLGSLCVYFANSLTFVIIGRALQGAGAISAVLLALLSDLTTDSSRTKSMAIIGASIALTFGISIILSPILNNYLGFQNIFLLISGLTLIAVLVLFNYIPSPEKQKHTKESQIGIKEIVFDKIFLKLDFGIFALHASQIIMFMMIPIMLNDIGYPVKYHWQIYLPVFVLSIIAIVPMVIFSSKKQMLKLFFLTSILLLITVQYLFANFASDKQSIMLILLMYFIAFNFLEASLPSLITRLSPTNSKGLILGAYNTSQSLGIFVGGILGGYMASSFSDKASFLISAIFLMFWFFFMLKFIFPSNKRDLVVKMKPQFFDQPQKILNNIFKKINHYQFVEETLIFPSESYIIIKEDKDSTLDQKIIIKTLGEKNVIS
jgi:MFS family permease